MPSLTFKKINPINPIPSRLPSLFCFHSQPTPQAQKAPYKMNKLYKQSQMSKSATAKGTLVVLFVALLSVAVWSNTQDDQSPKERLLATTVTTYVISSTRTSNYGKYCSGLNRTTLVTSSELASATSNMNSVSSALGIDGNAIIYDLTNMKLGSATSKVTSNVVNIAFFIGAFLVPFIIFLWVWPFLCCCCCCPSCCPSKCCQKAEDQPYSKCELFWPAIVLICALVLVIATSIYGFVNASNVGPAFNSLSCSLAVFTDDLLNGAVTTNQSSFFVGLSTFSSNLTDLNANLGIISANMNDLKASGSGTTDAAVTNIQAVEVDIKQIPDGAGTSLMTLTYNTPINSAAPGGTLASTFINKLGKWDTSNTLVYNLYVSVVYARAMMKGIKDSAVSFDGQIATINSQIGTMQTTINNLITNVKDMDSGLGTYLSYLNYPGSYGNLGMQGFYGFLILFSFFALLGTLLTVCCDKAGCRHLMYLSCIFLFLGALFAFIVAVLFSIFVPIFTWTCQYLNTTVSSAANFQTNFGAFLSNTTLDQISVCMPYGDGIIVNKVAGTAAAGINNLTSVISSLKDFNNATLQSYITGNLTALYSACKSYANGDISDLDTTNNNILAGLSDPTNTTGNAGCNAAFSSDSWVPSNNQDSSYSTAISCKVSNGNSGALSNCDNTFATVGGSACQGCMDSTQLLTYASSGANLVTKLDSRYTASCAFNAFLGNVWDNYYTIKYTNLGFPTAKVQVAGTVMYRVQQLIPTINDTTVATSVFKSINDFRSVLDTVNTNLAAVNSLTDPTYGMLAGLNCKLFGQDFVNMQNVICGSFYNNMYIIRLTFGISAWGILFAMCCIVCTGVRHFKQVDKMKKIADMDMMHQNFDEGTKNKLHNTKQ